MDYFIIGISAFLTSLLTFFSGFGLGTLLMPAFAVFFTPEAAIASTAVVHLMNNLFKLALLGRYANRSVVFNFGFTAIAGAWIGAIILIYVSDLQPIFTYQFAGRDAHITAVKCLVALLMIGFAIFEVVPKFKKLAFDQKYLKLGGFLSGFFGGISGHQGALRSAFLARSHLSKESFIGSGVAVACLVDIARIFVYANHTKRSLGSENISLILFATVCAFLGVWAGSRFLKKITMTFIQAIVSALLFVIAVLLGFGVI